MKSNTPTSLLLLCALLASTPVLIASGAEESTPFAIVIHGGAGTVTREKLSAEKDKAYRQALGQALQIGYTVLQEGGSSLDAVEATVRFLEDAPLFNAGKGAVLTAEGRHELDASIMDGKTLAAGSVAGITRIKNPISLARLVMEKSAHVMLIGEGAEAFAKERQIPFVENEYFRTPERWEAFQKLKEKEKQDRKRPGKNAEGTKGTVGAVALDKHGNLAAATSTGGMMNKRFGRVGDVPIIGAGTYADNAVCAVSCTGWGEFFIRSVVAHDIAARMLYTGVSLEKAAAAVLEKVARMGGDGGLIGIDRRGDITMPFNTPGMFRGYRKNDAAAVVKIYSGE